MEILDFFIPVDMDRLLERDGFEEATWYYALDRNTGGEVNLQDKKIALIGIEEPGAAGSEAAYEVRRYLYALRRAEYAEEIVDLGDFPFNYKDKTYESLGFVLSELMAANIVPVILNGRQEITYAQYLAFTYLKHYVNLVSFDARIDFDLQEHQALNSQNFLQQLLLTEPNYLFSFTNIGYQSHFADTSILEFLDKLYFDLYRLGDARAGMTELEPVLRSAHFVSWDLSVIRQGDAPGTTRPTPNGFTGEEACLLCRYAGLSSSLRSIGFYNFLPPADQNGQTAHLSAQMIWYFVDGYLNRYPESPSENPEDFMKYITSLENNAYQIVFYKSSRTDRWWMEIPLNEGDYIGNRYIMPCSYNDYLAATRGEIPDRWLHAVKKLS